MKTSQIMGLETEYATMLNGPGPFDPRVLFESSGSSCLAQWDPQPERPWNDARGFVPTASVRNDPEPELELLHTSDQIPDMSGRNEEDSAQETPLPDIEVRDLPGMLLDNGARFYLDHTHPEWSTPECATPLEAVAYDKAGELWLTGLVERFNASRDNGQHLAIYKNNLDAYGNSYGCHENYLVDAPVYTALFDAQAQRLYTTLIPFLVSRQVMCGAGKVARPQGGGDYLFQISQRADVLRSVLGLQTTQQRPIINTRDEPHADPTRFRRLHVIVGDSNLSEYSTFLKLGSTALVLEMLAAGQPRLDLTLADPVRAIRTISRDPSCRSTVELETDRRRLTAVDIQKCLLEAAGRYLDERDDQSYRRQVWRAWQEAADSLTISPTALASRVDWAAKYEFFTTQMNLQGWSWQSPEVRELDLKYHQIDPRNSLFHLLQRRGLIERLLDDQTIQRACSQPPAATRAHARTAFMNRYPDSVIAANWDTIVFTGRDNHACRWRWPDPTDNGGPEFDDLLLAADSPDEFIRRYSARERGMGGINGF